MPTTGANLTQPFVAGNVEFTPAGFTGVITNDFASVPYCNTDFGDYDTTATDHLATVNDPTAGIGDICRYMGVIDSANWRMPTAKDWEDLYGSAAENGGEAEPHGSFGGGSFTPLSGQSFGPRQNNVAIISNTQVDNADPYDDGALFLPASGLRNFNDVGSVYWIGSWGHCWSSTAQSAGNVYHIQFTSSYIWPQNLNGRAHAFPIRCIRE